MKSRPIDWKILAASTASMLVTMVLALVVFGFTDHVWAAVGGGACGAGLAALFIGRIHR